MTQTTIPKNSSAGMKCHVGPGCRLHSPTGIAGAKKALRLATEAVQNSSTLEEMSAAKNKMSAAQTQYDMTQEGQESLIQSIKYETDPLQKRLLSSRLTAAKASAEKAEEEFRLGFEANNSDLVNHIEFPNKSSYVEPTFVTSGSDSYPSEVGNKYTGYRPTTEIAKDIRKDLQEAQDKGFLPKNLSYNVTRETSSIKVLISGLKDEAILEETRNRGQQYTPEAKELRDRVSNIMNAYNSRCNMPQVDYFQNAFYGNTELEDERSRKWRGEEKNRLRNMREANKQKKVYKDAIENGSVDRFMQDTNTSYNRTSSDGIVFGRVGDSNFYAFKRVSPVNGRETFELYDFTSVAAPEGKTVEDIFTEGRAANLLARRKKNLVLRKS